MRIQEKNRPFDLHSFFYIEIESIASICFPYSYLKSSKIPLEVWKCHDNSIPFIIKNRCTFAFQI